MWSALQTTPPYPKVAPQRRTRQRNLGYSKQVENEAEVRTQWIGADSILYATAHRPWPPPQRQWLMTQTWHDLLFAHYRVDPPLLRRLVPEVLSLDLYRDEAWLSITPFRLGSLRPPGVPPLPRLSSFCELNVRTYVSFQEKPGVYFFSLDAASLSAVWGARTFYRLPYWHAKMRSEVLREENAFVAGVPVQRAIRYQSLRLHGPKATAAMPEFRAEYGPTAPPRAARRGSLEEFLAERYCLYAWNRDRLYRAEIHHLPWALQPAAVAIECNTMAEPLGLALPAAPDLTHFSQLLKVLVWAPERLRMEQRSRRPVLAPARA